MRKVRGEMLPSGRQTEKCKKLPRKSILGYFAMYPRINRQVSSITLPSILASFFRLPFYGLFLISLSFFSLHKLKRSSESQKAY